MIAKTPRPPYYAVIFTSTRTEGDNNYGKTAQRMAELAAGARYPAKLMRALDRAKSNPEAVERVGIHYAAEQCAGLLNEGVDGIHFYTLNKSHATREIYNSLGLASPCKV